MSFDRLGVKRGKDIVIPYGAFLTALVNFVIVAFVLFLVVKAYNRLRRRRTRHEDMLVLPDGYPARGDALPQLHQRAAARLS